MKYDNSEAFFIEEYRKIYKYDPDYGVSGGRSSKFMAPLISALAPESILDYGCGRSHLIKMLMRSFRFYGYKYDPCVPEYEQLPVKKVDLIVCTDVLEHIHKSFLKEKLNEIKAISQNAIFIIKCFTSPTKLTDGRSVHVTVEPPEWWINTIAQVFGQAQIIIKFTKKPNLEKFMCTTFPVDLETVTFIKGLE